MNRPYTILLHSGWDTVNIGDIGHTPGTLRVLEDHLPDADVVLWARRINDPIRRMLRRRFPRTQIVEGGIDRQGDPTTDALAEAFDRADLAIHNTSMGNATSLMAAARKRGKPYGLFGQSYFPDVAENHPLLDLLNDAAFVFCRDTLTLRTLEQARVASPVLRFNPDGCFGIDVRDDENALAFMAERGLTERQFITVQLRTNTRKHPNKSDALNPAEPTPQQVADDERRAMTFRELITAWVRETGYKVLIAPEVAKEIEHNKRLILDPLPPEIQAHVVLRDHFWNANEAASVFARAHTVVCHEPHSCIIALANGTPAMHLYSAFHGPKYHMFADIGMPQWLLPLDESPVSQIIERLMSIHRDHAAAQRRVREVMDGVEAHFAAACKTLCPLLERSAASDR